MFKLVNIFVTAVFLMLVADRTLAQNFWQPVGLDSQWVLALAIDPSGQIFVGAGANGVFRSTDNGSTWTYIGLSGTVSSLNVDSAGHLLAGVWDQGVYRSSDGGTTWTKVLSVSYPLDFSINSSGDIFFGAGWVPGDGSLGGIFRSTDNGQSWDSLAPYSTSALGISQSGYIFALASPIPPNYGGTAIFYSVDNGMRWTLLQMLDSTSYGWPMGIAVSPNDNIYCAIASSGVFRSTNNGNRWDLVLANHPTWRLAINLNGKVFVGTAGDGVFCSTNDGESWDSINSGLVNRRVGSLAVSSSGYLFAGTQGDGVFRSVQSTTSVREISVDLLKSFMLHQNYPNPFNPNTKISWQVPVNGHQTLKIYDVLGNEIVTLINEYKPAGNYEVEWDAKGFPSGVYFYKLQAGEYTVTKKLILMK